MAVYWTTAVRIAVIVMLVATLLALVLATGNSLDCCP